MKQIMLLIRTCAVCLPVLIMQSCNKEKEPHVFPVTDAAGNGYDTVVIGPQVWLVQNLRTTKYANGDLIGTTTTANVDISGEASPKYQWAPYGNENFKPENGRLYTWYVVTDSRGLCPAGWHVPSYSEIMALADYLITHNYGFGGSGHSIGKAMASQKGWNISSTAGTPGNDPATNNSSGFSAFPQGNRKITSFVGGGQSASFWTTTAYDGTSARTPEVWAHNADFVNNVLNDKYCGASVRCIKD